MVAFSILSHHGDCGALPDFAPFPAPADLHSALLFPEDSGWLGFSLLSAVSAFVATNLDDILLLVLLFSQSRQRRSALAIVGGQYLGIGLLVLVSLSGQLGRALVPDSWLGLLGLLPISLAVSRWLEAAPAAAPAATSAATSEGAPPGPEPALLAVAALTLANGSDNIGVYLPLFARASAPEALLTLGVFAGMAALWCLLAWWCARAPGLGEILRRQGPRWMPPLLAALGLTLLLDAHLLFVHRGLALVALLGLAALVAPLARRPPPFLAGTSPACATPTASATTSPTSAPFSPGCAAASPCSASGS
jgi:cadmium resistance protein CadD (predicted permease)